MDFNKIKEAAQSYEKDKYLSILLKKLKREEQ